MATKTVRLKVIPGMLEFFMSCFDVDSLSELQAEQNDGFQFISPRDCFVDFVLIKPDRVSVDIDEEGIPAVRHTTNSTAGPATFKELRCSPTWRSTLRLLARTGQTVMVAEGEVCMGRYSAVVLNGNGFQLERGKAGLAAAFSRPDTTYEPIRTTKEVVEMALKLSGPMSDDTPTPTESEIVAVVFRKIEEIRKKAE